jgi:hypothetical protein
MAVTGAPVPTGIVRVQLGSPLKAGSYLDYSRQE